MAPKRPLGDVVREQEKKRPKRTVLAVKQPLGAVVPEQEAAWPPRKRLKRTVLVVMWLLGGSAASRRSREIKEKVKEKLKEKVADILRQMADDFSKERKIGSGSYGEVYSAVRMKQPLGAVVPEQEAAWSPRKRLKRTVLVVMWLLEGSAAPRRERKKKVVSPTSSLFGVIFAEQEAARSPRKRLKRTVLVVMWLLEGSAAPRRERKKKVVSPTSSLFGVSSEPTFVPLDLLREITDGFSKERKIGSGSYGEVYLGVHQDGQKIAVKKIYDMPGVDDKQFQNEFKNLTRLRHTNIVQLVGYCHDIQEVQVKYQGKLVIAEKINRALCLEYMPNGSLEKYISDECDKYDWHTGYGIINGICQGLKYLHTELNPPIYHLDLKPANVLLDENMVPRIADFGISRLFGDERTRATLSTLGTQGYLPPEYIRYNLISSKFDIFSLGVVIIKIMAGRSGYFNIADMSPQEFTNLVQEKWTNRLHETSNLMKAHSEQVKTCIEIGLRCVDDDRQRRPSIQDIINRLHETETECAYAARKDRSSIYQLKVNQSTMPAYKKSHKRENSGGLTHDYFMNNSRPVHEVPLNNDVGPSIQARTAWQYPTDMTAQHELGEQQAALLPYGNYEIPYAELKANNWKMFVCKKFEERVNSGALTSDNLMCNGHPVSAAPLNNDAGPSVQARTTCQYPNDIAARHEFGDRRPLNGFSRATVQSNNGGRPSNQETLPFSQPTYEQTVHQGLRQHDPSMSQNETPYYQTLGNILSDQGSVSAHPTIPFHNFLSVPQDDMITGASLTAQGEGTSSLDRFLADNSSWFPSFPFEEDCADEPMDWTDHDIAPAELPNSNNQSHGGNWYY